MKKKSTLPGIITLAAGVAIAAIIGANGSEIIINIGIGIFRILLIAGVAVIGAGALTTLIPLISNIRNASVAKKNAEAQKAAEEEEARKRKEDVRGLVKQLMEEEVDFVPVGNILLKEMDDMDEFVERNDKLFVYNDMTEFESMKGIISQARNALYHNCRGVVNLYVALETSGEFTTEADKIIQSNNELLNNAKDFLLELARYTNEQNEDTDAVTMIQDYADAIGQSLRHTYD
ncbi:hypothetical protein [Butyrivibrio sp. VCB2006]|uniref:hypothetical protein n=1 Tax=Butyrivibrio sp. VCB2006 TaxID=1280679 RepID=UPI0003F533B4|nr:hypothetical protein [Butyrivibrio sp. VCB2006]